MGGAYLGGNIGYGSGVVSGPNHPDFNVRGWALGGQAGYNFDLSGADNIALEGRTNWTASLTGHVGYVAGAFMPYLLGGLAVADNTGTETVAPTGTDTENSFG